MRNDQGNLFTRGHEGEFLHFSLFALPRAIVDPPFGPAVHDPTFNPTPLPPFGSTRVLLSHKLLILAFLLSAAYRPQSASPATRGQTAKMYAALPRLGDQ